jgi:hypothetical protein
LLCVIFADAASGLRVRLFTAIVFGLGLNIFVAPNSSSDAYGRECCHWTA